MIKSPVKCPGCSSKDINVKISATGFMLVVYRVTCLKCGYDKLVRKTESLFKRRYRSTNERRK